MIRFSAILLKQYHYAADQKIAPTAVKLKSSVNGILAMQLSLLKEQVSQRSALDGEGHPLGLGFNNFALGAIELVSGINAIDIAQRAVEVCSVLGPFRQPRMKDRPLMTRRCALQKYSHAFLALTAALLPHLGYGQQPDAADGQTVLNSQVWRAFVTIVEREFEAPVSSSTLDALCLELVRLRSEKALGTTTSDCVQDVALAIDPEAHFTPAAERLPLPTGSGSRFGSFALELRRKQSGEPLIIESTIYGGPGERGGLIAGDAIVSVDGESLRPLSIEDCVRRLRGSPGTSSTLRISRNGSEFETQLIREVIRIQYVRGQVLEGGIAHVRISAFIKETTALQLAAAISRVWTASPSPVKGLVLDLRSNFGGDLKEVFAVSSLLTEPGTKLLTSALRSGVESFTSVPRTDRPVLAEPVSRFLEQAPLVVLVNSKTSSGAEALAFVLRRERNAQTLGERTAGLAGVRQVSELPDGSSLQLTIGRLLSPVGRNWSIDGVEIDQVVPDLPGYEYGQLPGDIVLLESLKAIRPKL